jgi:TRAP-type C4-dicarboxylate transport system permease small subunit
MQTLHRAVEALRQIATVVATLAFAALVLVFCYGVIARYVLHDPSDIASEGAVILYLWTIMIGGALAVTLHDHIGFELLVQRLGQRSGRIVEGVGALIAGAILLYALPTTIDYVLFLWREKTAALEWPLDKVYSCFILFQGAMALSLLARAAVLLFGVGRSVDDRPLES